MPCSSFVLPLLLLQQQHGVRADVTDHSSVVVSGVMDKNNDGHLSQEELATHLEETRDKLFPDHHSRVKQSFNSVDSNKDGWIDFEEHLTSIAQMIQQVQEQPGGYIAPEVSINQALSTADKLACLACLLS